VYAKCYRASLVVVEFQVRTRRLRSVLHPDSSMAEDQLDSSASLLAQYGQSDEDHIVVHSGIEVGRVRIRDVKELITHADRVMIADFETHARTYVEQEVQTGRIRGVDWYRFGRCDHTATHLEEWLNGMSAKVCSEPNRQHAHTVNGMFRNDPRC